MKCTTNNDEKVTKTTVIIRPINIFFIVELTPLLLKLLSHSNIKEKNLYFSIWYPNSDVYSYKLSIKISKFQCHQFFDFILRPNKYAYNTIFSNINCSTISSTNHSQHILYGIITKVFTRARHL